MHKLLRFLSVLLFLVVGLFLVSIANAENSFSWVTSPLSFQKGLDTTATPSSLNNNIDCQKQDVNTCSIPANYGAATYNGTVRLNGTANYWPVISYVDNKQHFLPIPNSSTFISYTTEPPYGFYLYFNYNFASSITKVDVFGGGIQYKVNRAPDGKLADRANHRLAADYTSMNFSQNGQWMVMSMPNVAMLRVNLQTFEVLPFGNGFNYTIGVDPAIRTTISNDGRYAAVSSQGFSSFKIYDLVTCETVPDTINGPVSCQSRDLKTFLGQQLPGYSFSSNLKFISNDALTAYATYFVGSARKTAMVTVGASTSISNQIEILGMGESFISGEGAFDYQGGTDTKDNKCHLSLISYPYLIGKDLSFNSYKSVACSGALTEDITNASDSYKGQAQNRKTERKQRKELEIDSIFASFKPGYINQSDFVSRYQPKVMLISVGGNDIGFSKIVTKCGVPWELATCYSSYEDRLELVREINNRLFPKLVQTYQIIKNSGAPDARIYVIGYPQIAKPGGNCALNVHLRKEEIVFSKQLISYLNSVIKLATSKAGVFYVDTEDALNDHRLCEAKGGSVAVNGLTLGYDLPTKFGPIGTESYHPNDLGHQLLENKILKATHNLTDSMPVANLGAVPPLENGQEILNAPQSGRTVYPGQHADSLTDEILFIQSPANININGAQYSLKPSASYRIELHSNPVVLGNYLTDTGGNLNAQIQLPANISPGSHTLHIYGTNVAGEAVDIYKTVYVAVSDDDYNGNGIPNSSDPCVFVDALGIDYDQDGIDDVCDGIISEAPPATPAPVVNTPSTQPPSDTSSDPAPKQSDSSGNTTTSPSDELSQIFSSPSFSPVVVSQSSSAPQTSNTSFPRESQPVDLIDQPAALSQDKAGKVLADTKVKEPSTPSENSRAAAVIVGGIILLLGSLSLLFGLKRK